MINPLKIITIVFTIHFFSMLISSDQQQRQQRRVYGQPFLPNAPVKVIPVSQFSYHQAWDERHLGRNASRNVNPRVITSPSFPLALHRVLRTTEPNEIAQGEREKRLRQAVSDFIDVWMRPHQTGSVSQEEAHFFFCLVLANPSLIQSRLHPYKINNFG